MPHSEFQSRRGGEVEDGRGRRQDFSVQPGQHFQGRNDGRHVPAEGARGTSGAFRRCHIDQELDARRGRRGFHVPRLQGELQETLHVGKIPGVGTIDRRNNFNGRQAKPGSGERVRLQWSHAECAVRETMLHGSGVDEGDKNLVLSWADEGCGGERQLIRLDASGHVGEIQPAPTAPLATIEFSNLTSRTSSPRPRRFASSPPGTMV